MSLTINIPDTLRKSVEAASKGQNTVMYTAKNQPCYMQVIPKFTGQSVDATAAATTHPAFIVGGVEKSYIYLGQYPGFSRNGEMLSLPGVDPINTITHDAAVDLARANGTGWHAMNNVEWAAIAQWCRANGFQPRGNTDYGRSSDRSTERAVDSATGILAATTGTVTTRTRTGSGPASWRHNNSAFGISDLCGNTWEWAPGMRVNNGEVNLISTSSGASANNETIALASTDMDAADAHWYAIDGATGALVSAVNGTPTAGTVRYASASTGTQDYTFYRISGQSFEGMVQGTGGQLSAAALALCKLHGICPLASLLGGTIAAPVANSDYFYINAAIEAMPFRGGSWSSAASAGVFALSCSNGRTSSGANIGARPALIL